MFEQATLSGGPLSTRLWSTCAGLTGQAFLVGTMLLVPLVWPAALPNIRNYVILAPPGAPPPPPPPPGEVTVRPKLIHATKACAVCTPVSIPKGVKMIVDDPPDVELPGVGVQGGVPGGVPNGVPGGLIHSILDSARPAAPPPPPPPVARPAPVQTTPAAPIQVRAGGVVQLGSPVVRIEPVYPPLARTARIEGVVELEAIVGVDGRVRELRAKSGHMFLVKAALDAVRQWVYAPTTLNGKPVEVISPVTVTFRLGR